MILRVVFQRKFGGGVRGGSSEKATHEYMVNEKRAGGHDIIV